MTRPTPVDNQTLQVRSAALLAAVVSVIGTAHFGRADIEANARYWERWLLRPLEMEVPTPE